MISEQNAPLQNLASHLKDTVDICGPLSNEFDMLTGLVGSTVVENISTADAH